ncbi:MAG TPA: heparan-alpha-glucosaminide N-acetyltransferase [Bauldia sp.]|nr:heparan-alpha-glucosaminide N-acetyltransferase [Bauldia sp.]
MAPIESRPPADRRGGRIAGIDALRGLAILAMVAYHFAWDLSSRGLIEADVGADPGWKAFARSIAGSFLALVGVSLVLAARGRTVPAHFLRRLAIVAGAAALVSAGTWWFIPDAFVFFGILHCIAVSSVLALPFLRVPAWFSALSGALVIAGPWFLADPLFDAPGWLWLGLATTPPRTIDYVPLFPWFGVVLLGVALGRVLVATGGGPLARWRPAGRTGRFLVLAGRWSLPIYLIHQLVLIGALSAALWIFGTTPEMQTRLYGRYYLADCLAGGNDEASCRAFSRCAATRLGSDAALMADAADGALGDDSALRWRETVSACFEEAIPPLPFDEGGG